MYASAHQERQINEVWFMRVALLIVIAAALTGKKNLSVNSAAAVPHDNSSTVS